MSANSTTPKIADLFVGGLAAIGNWVVANVRSSVAWPLTVKEVEFRGHQIFVVPRSVSTVVADGSAITMYPFVAVNLPAGSSLDDGRKLISHFLSSLSWVEGAAISVEHWTGGSRAHPMGEPRHGGVVTSNFELDYLPDPTDQQERWALAFFREGLSLERENVAYATLSYFKVLNIIANNGPAQKSWINSNVNNFGSNNFLKFETQKRLNELRASNITDLGDYLYRTIRCAVAHAGTTPTVDPENFEDLERLAKDLTLIRAMAAHVIEKEFRIQSRSTIWKEHLYELAGFKEQLGASAVERLKAGDSTLELQTLGSIERIRVKIGGRPTYAALDSLVVQDLSVHAGGVRFTASSDDGSIRMDFCMNFATDRLEFEFPNGLRISDDGSPQGARQIASALQFVRDYLGNGKLQVFDAMSGALLGRKDAFLPVNMIPDPDSSNRQIVAYEAEAERRAQSAENERHP